MAAQLGQLLLLGPSSLLDLGCQQACVHVVLIYTLAQSASKQCCDEHWGTRVSFNSGFLSVYAQQWDCWVIRQFYFQFFKDPKNTQD